MGGALTLIQEAVKERQNIRWAQPPLLFFSSGDCPSPPLSSFTGKLVICFELAQKFGISLAKWKNFHVNSSGNVLFAPKLNVWFGFVRQGCCGWHLLLNQWHAWDKVRQAFSMQGFLHQGRFGSGWFAEFSAFLLNSYSFHWIHL